MAAPLPGTARLHHLFAVALEGCGLRGGAAQAFRDAIRDAPGHAHTWFRLGDVLARGGRWLEASEAFAEAARRAPESVEYQGNLALSRARSADWEGAVQALRRLAELRPHEGEGYILLGGVLKRLRRYDEAIRAFRWAVRLRSSPTTRRFALGEALLGERGWKEAVAAWQDAQRLPRGAEPAAETGAGRSALHGHPGGLLAPGSTRARASARRQGASAGNDTAGAGRGRVPARDVEADLRREERDRSILHVFRQTRPFPIREGDRPAAVHVTPGRVREARPRSGNRS